MHAAWIYAQMVRWGQAPMTAPLLSAAEAVFRPDLHADALGDIGMPASGGPADRIGAFAGPPFRPDDIAAEVAAWRIRRTS